MSADDDETTPDMLIERAQKLPLANPLDPAALIMADDALDAALLLLREANRREKEAK